MKAPVEWILASGSPRRRELLSQLKADFRVVTADVEEWEPDHADPVEQVEENARRKGEAVAARHADALVIAADTTVALGKRLFAKPKNPDHAVSMLTELSGRTHQVLTGVALFFNGQSHVFHESSSVEFRPLDPEQISIYMERVHVFDKAGAYAIQEHGDLVIERYSGSFENIMGLPVQRLRDELVSRGWELLPELDD
ncbi:septum formation protein Maf [Puniceicoccales bacterium CK1056]|uniref:dTTP/UTP pyrophosphatase n=1 Tax=Oceanipulchritudo coccoides TaxID=2706888 RepID=A0A6B2M2Z8_9BACT|nr:Maf family protein [Oceanipulchritudo coccoides]NDV62474.1 septum formation protein Maf [Oceanipulchritudo coccoides]